MSLGSQLYPLHPNHQQCYHHQKHHSIQNRPPANPPPGDGEGTKNEESYHLSIIPVELDTQLLHKMMEGCTDRQTIMNCGGASDRVEHLNAGGSPDSKVIHYQWEEHIPCSLNKSPVPGIFLHYTPQSCKTQVKGENVL